MYFSPLFSLYVLAWDCPKKNAIYFNIQFAWKIKMGFHTLPKYRHTREQKYFTSLRTAVPAELIGTLSWIKNGNDYLLSAPGHTDFTIFYEHSIHSRTTVISAHPGGCFYKLVKLSTNYSLLFSLLPKWIGMSSLVTAHL